MITRLFFVCMPAIAAGVLVAGIVCALGMDPIPAMKLGALIFLVVGLMGWDITKARLERGEK